MEGAQERQTSYLSGDVPVDCVPLMLVSLTATRGPGTVCTGAEREPARVESPGPPRAVNDPLSLATDSGYVFFSIILYIKNPYNNILVK